MTCGWSREYREGEKTKYEEIDGDGRTHRKIDADVAFFIPFMPKATQPKLAVDVRTVNPSTIASKKDKAYLLANKQAAVNHADAQKYTMAKVIRCQSKNFDFESCNHRHIWRHARKSHHH